MSAQSLPSSRTRTAVPTVVYVPNNALVLLRLCAHLITEPAQHSAAEILYSLNNNNSNSTSDDVSSDVAQVTRRSLQVQQFEEELYTAAAAEQRQAHALEQRRLQQLEVEAAAARAVAAAAVVRDTSVQTDTVVQVVPQPEPPGEATIN
jgi:hypothetical protein